MKNKDFFEEQSEQSEIKTEIVRKYFWAWAKVISKQVRKRGNNKIGYVDLFSGQGTYEDGSKSTPMRILEGAIRDTEIREMLVTLFNDANSENCLKLQNEVNNLPQVELLKYKPKITNNQVDDKLASRFESQATIPTLFFLDP